MFGWFDPEKRLEKRYRKERAAAEKSAQSGDRARYAELVAKAEATWAELESLRAERSTT